MDKKEKQFNIKQRNLKGGPIIFILSAVILLVIVSGNYFSFLEKQLFEERKNHIVEFTDKASEIVDSVIEYSWQQVSGCEKQRTDFRRGAFKSAWFYVRFS